VSIHFFKTGSNPNLFQYKTDPSYIKREFSGKNGIQKEIKIIKSKKKKKIKKKILKRKIVYKKSG